MLDNYMFCRLNNYLPDTGGATFQSSGMLMTTVSRSPVATAELAALQRYQAIFPSTFRTYFHFQSCSLGHVVAVQKLDMLEINRTVVVCLPTYISMHRTRVEFLVP